ncbi:MAG: hypothetical protein JNM50_04840 [Chromatiales bacterium]|jgi:hypothetical protein|nr:hypothetical protein [Chromatiales bacterium]
MKSHHLSGVLALALAGQAGAACVAEGPLETARWIHARERAFAFRAEDADPGNRHAFLSATLYSLLRAEWECQDVEEGICALESDPWINAQDGEELQPISFDMLPGSGTSATVRMSYRFGWRDVSDPAPVPGEATLMMTYDADLGCWVLDDLIGREHRSLRKQLEDYFRDAQQVGPKGP